MDGHSGFDLGGHGAIEGFWGSRRLVDEGKGVALR